MTIGPEVIADFAVIMIVAAVVTYIFHWLKQPLVLGYLIAGIIIGPYTPPVSLIQRLDVLNIAADLGVVLLLFSVGLEFPLSRLMKAGLKVPLGIAAIEVTLMFIISFAIGWLTHWTFIDSLFLGTALASSSTVIIGKVLGDYGRLKEMSAMIMMGVLVVEDLIVVFILTLIMSLVGLEGSVLPSIGWSVVKIVLFLFVTLFIGRLVVPKIIDRVSRIESDEVSLLIALGLCFALAVSSYALGFSLAIGAFLMGVLIATAKSASSIVPLISPIKDMFAAMFFVSMGALIDISQFRLFLIPALIVTITMMVGKIIGCGLGTRVFGYDTSTSIKVGLGMGQIGEFAFIVAKVGQDLNVVTPALFPTISVAAAITAFTTPYMIKLSFRLAPDYTPFKFIRKRITPRIVKPGPPKQPRE